MLKINSKIIALLMLLFFLFIVNSPLVQAQQGLIPVTVTIIRVIETQCDEDFGESCPNDFYSKVNIASLGEEESDIVYNNADFSPFWTFTRLVDPSLGTIPITIRLRDQDDLSADDDIDISAGDGGDRTLNLTLDLNTGNWGGEVQTNLGYSEGSGLDSAKLFFDIVMDSDGDLDDDGIPDGVERFGILDENGNLHTDMAALGADPCRKNIAVEIDFMDGADDHSHQPYQGAIDELMEAFNDAPVGAYLPCPYAGFPIELTGVGLILDVSDPIAEQPILTFGPEFDAIRADNFDLLREPYFHYSLWVHDINENDSAVGLCCTGPLLKDFLVGLGTWPNQEGTVRLQSIAFMHELGHALGLGHGGGDGVNFKPNYISIMNYRFGWNLGIINGSSFINPHYIDYSRAALPSLNEISLNEMAGISDGTLVTFWTDLASNLLSSPGSLALDWTGNNFDNIGSHFDDTNVTVDINGDRFCIWPGANGVLDSVPEGNEDDVIFTDPNTGTSSIIDGVNRTCDTNALNDDEYAELREEGDEWNTQPAILTGYDDWGNIHYRAEMSPGAGIIPPPPHVEIEIEDIINNQEKYYIALNTTDLSLDKNAIPEPILPISDIESIPITNTLLFSIYLPLVGNNSALNSTDLIVAAAGTSLDYIVTITNSGPNNTDEAQIIDDLPSGVTHTGNNADCIEEPTGTLTCNLGQVTVNKPRDVLITVLIAPDLVYNAGHPITITNDATVENIAGLDLYQMNNIATVDVKVIASADLEILDYAIVDAPLQMMVGEPVTVTLRKTIINNGPSGPMDVTLSDITTAPPDSTITPGQINTVEYALGLEEQRVIGETFTIQCDGYSSHTFNFSGEIQPLNTEDIDPDLSNNQAETILNVECVLPIAIDIIPGQINLNSNGVVPVLALDNEAGEFGLPFAFDASTIDPLSVRFGPRDVIWEGTGGASEAHGQGHGHGLGMMLHFGIQETGLSVDDTEACLKGTWYDENGNPHTFFGCDTVVVIDPGANIDRPITMGLIVPSYERSSPQKFI